jgi:predicted transcriptional regulator YdeE
MTTTKTPREYEALTADGRYGLTAREADGYHHLYVIVADTTEEWDEEMERLLGPYGDYEVGIVANPENIEEAAEAVDEEMAHLMAEARVEFG